MVEQLTDRYRLLANMVTELGQSVMKLQDDGAGVMARGGAETIARAFAQVDQAFNSLDEAARQLMQDAREANLKDLVRHVDSLRQSLQATRHRFAEILH